MLLLVEKLQGMGTHDFLFKQLMYDMGNDFILLMRKRSTIEFRRSLLIVRRRLFRIWILLLVGFMGYIG